MADSEEATCCGSANRSAVRSGSARQTATSSLRPTATIAFFLTQLAFHPLECRLPVAVAASGMLGDLVHRRTQVQPPGFGDAAVSVDLALSWTSAPSPP